MSVIEITNRQPAVIVSTKAGVHVLPESLINDVSSGKTDITQIENYDRIAAVIVREWYELLKRERA